MTTPLRCPACTNQPLAPEGARQKCPACAGVFISNEHVQDMLAVTAPDTAGDLEQRLVPRAGLPRRCPVCRRDMRCVAIENIDLERCDADGVWFDANELAWVLELDSLSYGKRHHRRHTGKGGQPHAPDRAGIASPPRRKPWWKFW